MVYDKRMARMFTESEVRELINAAVAPLLARIAELESEVAKLKKDSSTSSKPPSSDIVKPPQDPKGKKRRGKRRQGGQRGHQRHVRQSFPPEQIDHTWIYEWSEKLDDWEPLDQFRVVQQVELATKLFAADAAEAANIECRRDWAS